MDAATAPTAFDAGPALLYVITGLLSLVSVCLGWFARVLWEAVNKLRMDLQALEVQIVRDYVRYDRLRDELKPISDGMQSLLNEVRSLHAALSTKVDRSECGDHPR